ncbi:hypothetical protein MKEN_00221000 [Mycena kentingensis (nom. inval.)]|nr:hypothetical protein MKEN_00221000 [Mycena kentingensis (nom. inval.)]
MLFSTLLLLPFFALTNAANDWSKPCISGQCSYDLSTNGTSSGTMTIWGDVGAISDITEAADWEILGCDPDALSQEIRIVCRTEGSKACAHLYEAAGAVNKIIRLPESCGGSAFARISKSWIPEDQSIPSSIARRIVRRAGTPPQVKALAFDTDFDSVDYSKTGAINFAIQGSNVPEAGYSELPLNNVGPSGRSTHLSERGLFDFAKKAVNTVAQKAQAVVAPVAKAVASPVVTAAKKVAAPVVTAAKKVAAPVVKAAKKVAAPVVKAAKKVAEPVVKAAKAAGSAVKDAAKAAGKAVKGVAKTAGKAVKAAVGGAEKVAGAVVDEVKDDVKAAGKAVKAAAKNEVSAKKTFTLKPLDVNKNVNLINKSVSCGPVTAKLTADLNANAHAQATISVAASGTLVPPKITDFGVITGLDAQIDASVDLNANVAGSIDSGKIPVFSIGIPGLDFPGILTIGPSFDVNAQFTGSFEVDLDMNVGIVFSVNNAQIAFPPGTGANPSGNAFSIGDTPLSIAATPNVKATGTIAAHLIPSLNLGINALGGKAKATVHVDLDASASAKLTLEAGVEGLGKTIDVADKVKAAATGGAAKAKATPAAAAAANNGSDGADAAAKDTPAAAAGGAAAGGDAKSSAAKSDKADASSKAAKADTPSSKAAPATTSNTSVKATADGKFTKSEVSAALAAAAARKTNKREVEARAVTASFGGCFEVDAGVNVLVGADATFFGLFNTGASKSLFKKDFQIFKKCFGNQARRDLSSLAALSQLDARYIEPRALKCPVKQAAKPASVTSGTVSASNIRAA